MQTKFIAGPWAVFHDHPDADTAKSVATIRRAGSERHDEEVCNVFLCNYPGETGERMTATARLIAAAPAMFEALEAMLDDVGRASSLPSAIKARAALAAAIEYTPAQEAA